MLWSKSPCQHQIAFLVLILVSSYTLGTLVQTVPHKPSLPPSRDPSTSPSQVAVGWSSLISPDDGGSPITSYNLWWDSGSGVISTSLTGYPAASLALSSSVAVGIVPGALYQFKYRASNIYGWGPFSDPANVSASGIPGPVLAPTTEVENVYVKITWAYPSDNSAAVD
jgi:hypothetical protein